MDDVILQQSDNSRRYEPRRLPLLVEKAQLIISTEDDGAFTLDELNKTIEKLEELLYKESLFGGRSNYKTSHIEDFETLSLTLPFIIIQLKERVFQRQAALDACGAVDDDNESFEDKMVYVEYAHLWAVESSKQFHLLEQRSQAGCILCGFLREHFLDSLQDSTSVSDSISDDSESGSHYDLPNEQEDVLLVWLQFDWGDAPIGTECRGNILQFVTVGVVPQLGNSRSWTQRRFFVGTPDTRLADELGLLSPLRPTPLDPANLTLIKQCLRFGDHETAERKSIPKRLLDWGPTDQCLHRVIDTISSGDSANDQRSRYATLSYCWGPPEYARHQFLLTSETKDRLYNGISMEDLTPVVRDAVITCRTLGFRYLWVDALCILQQDTADWEEQSYEMQKIFTGSGICICVTTNFSCLESFLNRPPHAQLDLVLASTDASLHNKTLTLTPCSRGDWVDQSLGNIITSENGYVFKDKPDHQTCKIQPMYSITRNTILSYSDIVPDMWYSILERFADLNWTNVLDILPGLSGIARMFQDIYKGDYVAGLWANDIECGLLWETYASEQETLWDLLQSLTSGHRSIGPSWSWVSHHGVHFGRFSMSAHSDEACRIRRHLRSEIQHLGVESQIEGKNPFGRVHCAAIKIGGTLLKNPGGWDPIHVSPKTYWCTMPHGQAVYLTSDWDGGMDMTDEDRHKIRFLLLVSCCSEPSAMIRDWVIREDGEWNPGSRSWKESVIHRPKYRQSFYQDRNRGDGGPEHCALCSPEHERDVWGLLIYPAIQPGTYYRVGTFMSRAVFGGLSVFDRGYTDTITLV
ncbi:heterokaryon incompatibility protein-domain-containing protein [Apiospora marii]|uniref:Heterokaryon incompatibility protein-domain-containing protein n=1 Tax=Apiospora marii TaxID=335849 RepID=A0ABR1RYB2_9PEZI